MGDPAVMSTVEPSDAEGIEVEVFVRIDDACGRSTSVTERTVLSQGEFR